MVFAPSGLAVRRFARYNSAVRLPFLLLAAVSAALVLLGPAEGAFPGSNGLIAYSCNGNDICKVNPDG